MAYSLDLRQRAIVLLGTGHKAGEVGVVHGVSERTVVGWKKRQAEGGLAAAYPAARGAYHIDDEALKAHLKAHPDAYLEELAAVAGGTGQGIRDALKRLKITCKKRPRNTGKEIRKNVRPIRNG